MLGYAKGEHGRARQISQSNVGGGGGGSAAGLGAGEATEPVGYGSDSEEEDEEEIPEDLADLSPEEQQVRIIAPSPSPISIPDAPSISMGHPS